MTDRVREALLARSSTISDRWEALLRSERLRTPLASPDALVFWIPKGVELSINMAARPSRESYDRRRAATNDNCPCTRNPYLAFYRAGEQALLEALRVVQRDLPTVDERDELALRRAIQVLACRDIDGFCRVCVIRDPCQKRPANAGPACGGPAYCEGAKKCPHSTPP